MFGGNANNGANDGLVYSNSNNAFSNTNSNIGSRHTLAEYAIRDAGRLYWRHPGHRKPWSVVTQRCVGHECQNNGTLRLSSVVGNMVLVGRRRFGRSMQNAMQGLVCKVCKVCKVASLFFFGMPGRRIAGYDGYAVGFDVFEDFRKLSNIIEG